MKKLLLILAVLLAVGLVALFIFKALPADGTQPADAGVTEPSGTAVTPGTAETTQPENTIPMYTFTDKDTPSSDPTGSETPPEDTTPATAEPGLDENETPKIEF